MTSQIEYSPKPSNIITPKLQLIAWEVTQSCNLFCAHCRGSAGPDASSDELSTDECFRLIDQILEVGNPIIILTGGEPLNRPDFLQIAKYAVSKGLRVVMGTNGTLITEEIAYKLKEVPISRLGISLDFPIAKLQDEFRGQTGAFDAVMNGVTFARKAGMEVQFNSTITKLNVNYLEELLALAIKMEAIAFHPFMLVPTGRGKNLESVGLSSQQYEETLNWVYDKQIELGDRIFFKPTDAPHYLRVMKQRQRQDGEITPSTNTKASNPHGSVHSITRGCLAGTGFCFISHKGRVQGCGYLDVEAGNVRDRSFGQIWNNSTLFKDLRNLSNIKGKCGMCEYKRICGGCRARAYEDSGDYLEAEPYCLYEPTSQSKDSVDV